MSVPTKVLQAINVWADSKASQIISDIIANDECSDLDVDMEVWGDMDEDDYEVVLQEMETALIDAMRGNSKWTKISHIT